LVFFFFFFRYEFIGNKKELDTVYNATILSDEEQSADIKIQTQITATKHSQTMKPAVKQKRSGQNVISTNAIPPVKKFQLKTSKMKYVKLPH
jgi:hypothetical protein